MKAFKYQSKQLKEIWQDIDITLYFILKVEILFQLFLYHFCIGKNINIIKNHYLF